MIQVYHSASEQTARNGIVNARVIPNQSSGTWDTRLHGIISEGLNKQGVRLKRTVIAIETASYRNRGQNLNIVCKVVGYCFT